MRKKIITTIFFIMIILLICTPKSNAYQTMGDLVNASINNLDYFLTMNVESITDGETRRRRKNKGKLLYGCL